jgi:hypothetical protein
MINATQFGCPDVQLATEFGLPAAIRKISYRRFRCETNGDPMPCIGSVT